MTLPQSEELSTSAMNRVFDDTTATYKFYWLLALLDMHVKEQLDEMLASMSANMQVNPYFIATCTWYQDTRAMFRIQRVEFVEWYQVNRNTKRKPAGIKLRCLQICLMVLYFQITIGPWPMQLVVPRAVRAAVRIDTMTWMTVFQVSFFMMISY